MAGGVGVGGLVGAAPHVLHHVGLVAGASLLAGTAGTLLFGALGLLAAIPVLVKVRRRTGGWLLPSASLALFAAVFALSSLVLGPLLTGAWGAEDPDRLPPPAGEVRHEGHR
jgi:hypothetical protein